MTYSGRVYDGPLEGQHHTEHQPSFYVAICPPLPEFVDLEAPIAPVDFPLGIYRWSEPLHAWVFVWEK